MKRAVLQSVKVTIRQLMHLSDRKQAEPRYCYVRMFGVNKVSAFNQSRPLTDCHGGASGELELVYGFSCGSFSVQMSLHQRLVSGNNPAWAAAFPRF